jgi:hypothetical protein
MAFQLFERLTQHCVELIRKPNRRMQCTGLVPEHAFAAEQCRQCGCEYVISVEHRGAHVIQIY